MGQTGAKGRFVTKGRSLVSLVKWGQLVTMGHVIMCQEGRPVFTLTREAPSTSVWTLVSDVDWIYDHVARPVGEEQLLADADEQENPQSSVHSSLYPARID